MKYVYSPKVETTEYVEASNLFFDLDALQAELCQIDNLPFTWGSNNRSLVCADDILDVFDNRNTENVKQLRELRKRVKTLPEQGQTYIDLEN